MVKKPTRLRFTEDDLSDPRVKSAYEKAQKQTDKAERAVERITSGKITISCEMKIRFRLIERKSFVLLRQVSRRKSKSHPG